MTRMPLHILSLFLLIGLIAPHAQAQQGWVTLDVSPYDVGIDGNVRTGTWTPLRLTVLQQGGEPRDVIYRWHHRDFDGDRIIAQRTATLTPGIPTTPWLYANPRVEADDPWLIQVLEANENGQPGAVLAETQVAPRQYLRSWQTAIGIMGNAQLGLAPYEHLYTRHESLEPIRGLAMADLPDRWHGLRSLEALVWTAQADTPQDAAPAQHEALRQWVHHGGHLIIMLPAVGEPWTNSPLADLLPINADQLRRVNRPPPAWLGLPQVATAQPVDYLVFEGSDTGRRYTVRRDDQQDPLLISARRGFGQVTVLGIDLTQPAIVQQGIPAGESTVWNEILRSPSPTIDPGQAAQLVRNNDLANPERRSRVELARFITPMISMTGTAGPALLASIFIFGLYWLLAGPVAFAYLKQRNALRYSWLAFTAVVLGFAMISWGGAYLMQPRSAAIAHFSVVDLDAADHTARTQSWFSIYVPEFGRATLELESGDAQAGANLLSFPGLPLGIEPTAFLDPQTYTVHATSPEAASIPVRSTAKQGELTYSGSLRETRAGLDEAWLAAAGTVTRDGAWPAGELRHTLPRELRNVIVIYCPGNGQTPWAWRHGTWESGEPLDLSQRSSVFRLVNQPATYFDERNLQNEGLLGHLMHEQTGERFVNLEPWQIAAADNEIIQSIEMLSFFAMLPPPDFTPTAALARARTGYHRQLARSLDLTPLTHNPRVILIGHMNNAPLPAPLTLDGRTVPSEGWTVVRMIYDLD